MGSSPKGGLKCCHTETTIIMSFNGSTKAEESSNKRVNTEDVTMAVEDKEGTENKEILTTGPIPPSMGTPGTLSIRSSAENINNLGNIKRDEQMVNIKRNETRGNQNMDRLSRDSGYFEENFSCLHKERNIEPEDETVDENISSQEIGLSYRPLNSKEEKQHILKPSWEIKIENENEEKGMESVYTWG